MKLERLDNIVQLEAESLHESVDLTRLGNILLTAGYSYRHSVKKWSEDSDPVYSTHQMTYHTEDIDEVVRFLREMRGY